MGGARLLTHPPGDALLRAIDEGAREAAIEIGRVETALVKELILTEKDSRGFVGRYDIGTAHDAVRPSAPRRTPGGWSVEVAMGSPVPPIVAAVLEKGRRPGQRPPPTDAIEPWVRRKLRDRVAKALKGRVSATRRASLRKRASKAARMLKAGRWTATEARAHERGGFEGSVVGVKGAALDSKIRSVAFLVARAIGRNGTPGLGMFKKAARLMRAGRAQRIVRDAMRRAFAARAPGSRR